MVKQYPSKRVVLVMDNAAYHKSASALAALSLFEHLAIIIWLPPYCSDLNPIELFWRYLKDHACANKLQDNIEEVVKAAVKIMNAQNCTISDPKFHVSRLMADYLVVCLINGYNIGRRKYAEEDRIATSDRRGA